MNRTTLTERLSPVIRIDFGHGAAVNGPGGLPVEQTIHPHRRR
jgi:hypothetical protein